MIIASVCGILLSQAHRNSLVHNPTIEPTLQRGLLEHACMAPLLSAVAVLLSTNIARGLRTIFSAGLTRLEHIARKQWPQVLADNQPYNGGAILTLCTRTHTYKKKPACHSQHLCAQAPMMC